MTPLERMGFIRVALESSLLCTSHNDVFYEERSALLEPHEESDATEPAR
jgi:hypothetical protein